MSVYKKKQINGQMSRYYYYEFKYNGKRYRGTTGKETEAEAKALKAEFQTIADKEAKLKGYGRPLTSQESLALAIDLEKLSREIIQRNHPEKLSRETIHRKISREIIQTNYS